MTLSPWRPNPGRPRASIQQTAIHDWKSIDHFEACPQRRRAHVQCVSDAGALLRRVGQVADCGHDLCSSRSYGLCPAPSSPGQSTVAGPRRSDWCLIHRRRAVASGPTLPRRIRKTTPGFSVVENSWSESAAPAREANRLVFSRVSSLSDACVGGGWLVAFSIPSRGAATGSRQSVGDSRAGTSRPDG